MWVQAATTMGIYQAVSSDRGGVDAADHAGAANPEIGRDTQAQSAASEPASRVLQQVEQVQQNPLQDYQQQIVSNLQFNTEPNRQPGRGPAGLVDSCKAWASETPTLRTTRRSTFRSTTSSRTSCRTSASTGIRPSGTINGATYDSYADPTQASFWVARSLELFEDFQKFASTCSRIRCRPFNG